MATIVVAAVACFAALVAALVTPFLALAALGDVSKVVMEDPDAAAAAIPIAQLPPGLRSIIPRGSHLNAFLLTRQS